MRARLASICAVALVTSGCSLVTGFSDFRFGDAGPRMDGGSAEAGRRDAGSRDGGDDGGGGSGCPIGRRRCDDGTCALCCTSDDCGDPQTPLCRAGRCVCETSATCDDADACTEDSCSATGVCRHEPKRCDDAISCTMDACDRVTGNCTRATICPSGLVCGAGGACERITCSDATGCPAAPDACARFDCVGGACSEVPVLTCGANERCFDRSGDAVCDCDDGWARCGGAPQCTVDIRSDPAHCGSCDASCDDGSACTTDRCVDRVCASTSAAAEVCNDEDDDCDGEIDEELYAASPVTGTEEIAQQARIATAPEGFVLVDRTIDAVRATCLDSSLATSSPLDSGRSDVVVRRDPDVATLADGDTVLSFVEQTTSDQHIELFRGSCASGFGPLGSLTMATATADAPRLAAGADGSVYLGYSERMGTETLVRVGDVDDLAGGVSGTEVLRGGSVAGLALAAHPTGAIFVVALRTGAGSPEIVLGRVAGSEAGPEQVILRDASANVSPEIAVSRDRAYVLFGLGADVLVAVVALEPSSALAVADVGNVRLGAARATRIRSGLAARGDAEAGALFATTSGAAFVRASREATLLASPVSIGHAGVDVHLVSGPSGHRYLGVFGASAPAVAGLAAWLDCAP